MLEAKAISKTFVGFQALKRVDFSLDKGQVHALCGSNGAGKSTLMKVLTGAIRPDSGQVIINGQDLKLGNPLNSLKSGIACIYQHSNLVAKMNVADNILMARQPTKPFGIIDQKAQIEWVDDVLKTYNIHLDPYAQVDELSTVKQKEVEIAKALSYNAKVVLMDEPTAWLAHNEVLKLFATIRKLKNKGVGIVYISHVLDDIYTVCDHISILRDGMMIKSGSVNKISKPQLIHFMVGKLLDDKQQTSNSKNQSISIQTQKKPILELKNLSKTRSFQNINLDIYPGQILTITGLLGSKRSQLVRTIFGVQPADSGSMYLDGKEILIKSPQDAINHKIGFVCEDRHQDGLMQKLNISDNIIMASLQKLSVYPFIGGIIKKQLVKNLSKAMVKQLGIVPVNTKLATKQLSGGNQQKVLIARWLSIQPKLIILDEPTVGVDVAAKADIYNLLGDLAKSGKAVLIVSSDIEEVVKISHKVLIMAQGQIVQSLEQEAINQDNIISAISQM